MEKDASSPLLKILLVEDSPSDVELTSMAFQDCKIPNRLSVVNDGEEALDFLFKRGRFTAESTPDLILLDINIPKQNGQEVLEIVKKDPKLKTIPVVILTTSDAERDIMRSYNLMANCYIIKPLHVDDYLIVVKCVENFWLNLVQLPTQVKVKGAA